MPAKKQPTKATKKRAPLRKKTAADAFVSGLVERGEAAKCGPDGKLPLDATHAITKENEDGTVAVKRSRFKLF